MPADHHADSTGALPAAELAAGYAWRWAIETGYRELKTYLRGPGRRLRGQTPALARQELSACLSVYQAIRVLIARAAASPGIDPDRISLTAALHAARGTMGTARASMNAALAGAEAEILTCLVPRRDGRVCPRAVNKPVSPYPSKRNHADPLSRHSVYTVTFTQVLRRLGSVAALAQGDGGEQRGGGQERGRQVQRIVQRAGEGRVPGLDDLVQRPVSRA